MSQIESLDPRAIPHTVFLEVDPFASPNTSPPNLQREGISVDGEPACREYMKVKWQRKLPDPGKRDINFASFSSPGQIESSDPHAIPHTVLLEVDLPPRNFFRW